MLNVGHFRQGFAIGVTMAIRRIMPAIVVMVTLRVCMIAYGISLGDQYIALIIISGLLAFILFPTSPGNEFHVANSAASRAASTLLSWLTLFAILLFLAYVTKSSDRFSRVVLIAWFVLAPLFVFVSRLLLARLLSRLMVSTRNKRHAIIAGVNPMAVSMASHLSQTPEFGLVMDGFFEDRSRERLGVDGDLPIVGKLRDIPDYVRQNHTDVIFIAVPIKNVSRVTELLDNLHDTTASIYFVPDVFVFDLIQCRTVDIRGIHAVALCETPFFGLRGVIKRASDYVFAVLALIIASPLMLATAIAIKLTSPGPIIFKQRRYGLDGQEITVYKFRSMTVTEDSGEIRQAQKGDPRLSPIGGFIRRYSIDELPQFINVLQGRMSVVGPRPHAVSHNEEYRKVIKGYMVRHKVAPGITGLAQVSGYRGETESLEQMEKRIALDLDYLRNWSLALDIRIILKTIRMVFRDDNAY